MGISGRRSRVLIKSAEVISYAYDELLGDFALVFLLGILGSAVVSAMVLLVAGPATNFATLGVVGKLLGKKSTVIYVLTVMVTALLAGFLFDRLFTLDLSTTEPETGGFELPLPVQASASVVLAGLLLFHVGRRLFRRSGKST
jgi:hypothetical protein